MTTKPVKPTVPPAPSRANPGSDFATKADAFAAFFSPFATYLDAVGTFTDGRADAALAAALAGDLPALTGQAGNYLRLNGAGTALEWRTPAQVATQTRGLLDDRIINGAFNIWQRGTSGTGFGYVAADRWANERSGGTVTQSREDFAPGEKLGSNNPRHFLRQNVTDQSAANHFAGTDQRIERVRSYAGETITVLGFARRASGAGNMAINVFQSFGTGGSPSAAVGLPGQQVALTSTFQPFAVTFAIPSIIDKTIGTDGNDFLGLRFWTSAGSDFSSSAASLGIQTIIVDLWGIHILPGTHVAAAALNYVPRTEAEELAACERYYETGSGLLQSPVAGFFGVRTQMATRKRGVPSVTISAISGEQIEVNPTPQSGNSLASIGFNFQASGPGGFCNFTWAADAEL
jgi:hypothetical protein